MRPVVQLFLPGSFFSRNGAGAGGLVAVAHQSSALQALQHGLGRGLGIAMHTHRDLFDQTQVGVVGLDLNDLGVFGPVVQPVLRQRAKRTHARAQCHHHISLGDQFHGRFGTLVTQRAAPQRVAGRESIVAQVTGHHWRTQTLSQRLAFGHRVPHHHATTGQNDRELGIGQQLSSGIQAVFTTGTTLHAHWLGDFAGDFTIEIVARNIELGRPHFGHGAVKAARGVLGHAFGIVHVALVFGELLKHRQLVGLLEAAQAHAHSAGLGRDHHDRAVGPVGGGNGGHAVADAGSILANHHTVTTADTGITVGHVAGALLMHHRDKLDTGRGKDVHRVHEGRAHDAEDLGHAIGGHGLDKGLRGRHFLRSSGHGGLVGGGVVHGKGTPEKRRLDSGLAPVDYQGPRVHAASDSRIRLLPGQPKYR